MPLSVTTMWSANSVPSTTSLSKPLPPSTDTGALMLYSTWFWPSPVRISVWAAVEKPLVSRGMAIRSAALIHTIAQVAVFAVVAVQAVPPNAPPIVVCARAKARTTNRSLSSSPSRRSAAWLE